MKKDCIMCKMYSAGQEEIIDFLNWLAENHKENYEKLVKEYLNK